VRLERGKEVSVRRRIPPVVAVALVVGACASPGSTSPSVVPTPPASAPAVHGSAVPSPRGSASARAPICPALSPPWVAATGHPNDGVPDAAGRILFGQIHREDEVIGQVIAPLFSMDADGSDVVQVFSCELERPRVSHDGRRIAFSIAMDDQTWQVATIAADGSDLRILTSTTGYAETPDWSPDGSWLIYAMSPVQCSRDPLCDSLHETLWRVDADGSDPREVGRVVPTAWDWEPRLSPDGKEVVFARADPNVNAAWTLTIMNLATGQERVAKVDSRDLEHPDWSPDGRFIIYHTSPNGPIERIPADDPTAQPEVLAYAGHITFKPAYSPDGSSIVFGCDTGVCRMNADGSGVVELLRVQGVDFNHFDWGPPSPG
jgi:Tol biopolymer transport system component